ncbi:peptidylprolyl isomerase [Chloroflexota bacterium]
MSQSRKKRTDKRPVEQAPSSNLQADDRQRRRTGIIVAAVVIVVMAAIIGFFSYQQYVAPYQHKILIVDDIDIRMDYFLKRMKLAGDVDSIEMLTLLTREQIMMLEAPGFGIEAGPEDADEALRAIFQGDSETISESEYKEWYRQRRNETGLSDDEFIEYTATFILRARLQEYLAERMPTVAEQAHLSIILVETYQEAEEAKARWDAGEDFTDLVRELSADNVTRENGGELGWFPRSGVLNPQAEFEAFNLSPGDVSQPIALFGEASSAEDEQSPPIVGYYLLMVSERATRELDEFNLQAVKSNALEDWLSAEMGNHTIKYHGFKNGFDSETYAWINWQLAKSQPISADQTP